VIIVADNNFGTRVSERSGDTALDSSPERLS